MPKNETAQAATPPTPEPDRSDTKWGAFDKAGLVPTEIMCQAYLPVFQADFSCHTRLLLQAQNIKNHIDADHGGGFRFTLKKHPKTWKGWAGLRDLGLECHDLRCEVCDAKLPMHPQNLLGHMRPHPGKNRRILPGGVFWLTIKTNVPIPDEDIFEDEQLD